MQITIRLKGFLKIAAFFVLIILMLAYFSRKVYKYVQYRNVWHNIQLKRKSKLVFKYKFELADSSQKGYILLSPNALYNDHNEIIIMDFKGHVVTQKTIKNRPSDFRQWNLGGHICYSYFTIDSGMDNTVSKIGSNGYYVILDSSLNEIKQIHLLPHDDILVNKNQGLDGHDFILLSDDHYVVMTEYEKKVSNIPAYLLPVPGGIVEAPIIQEVKEGKVIWQWDATHYPEFYSSSVENNKFYDTLPQDYIHLNSMILDPRDSDLIISLHNTNQVVKISRHTGDIIWRLGGLNSDFPLTVQQVFLRQHNVTLTDSNTTLMLFDNGEKSIRPSSRVLEYKLDEKNKMITSFKAYNIPELYSEAQGSVQKIGDDYFICGGYDPYLLLVNSITGTKKMKMVYNQGLYRAYVVKDISSINLAGK